MTLYNILYNNIKKAFFFSIFFLLAPLFFSGAASGQDDDRLVMEMFYREDDLVVSATRHPQPISQVAENMAIVSSEEIKNMNAHMVAEVLERIPGVFIANNRDFGTASNLQIQGSEQRHVLVLLDGMPLNFLSEGSAETNTVPVSIIDRIELIKGPASSAWGSSLGGVVNIITKSTGTTQVPSGSLSASYGRNNSQDYRAEVSGRSGAAGYYLFAGRRDSDGLRDDRWSESNSLYGKLTLPVFNNGVAGITMGYAEPETLLGRFKSQGIDSEMTGRNFFTTASLDLPLHNSLSFHCSLYDLHQKNKQSNTSRSPGAIMEEYYYDLLIDEHSAGGSSRLAWEKSFHTAVLGIDFNHSRLTQKSQAGKLLQAQGVEATLKNHPDEDRWAVYANDTMVLGRFSVTPGIRYDRNSVSGSFLSPSLGATFRLARDILLRLSAARGFTSPPLIYTSIRGVATEPNPSLDPEKVWSYQAGIETGVFKYFMLNAMLFYHDLHDAFFREQILTEGNRRSTKYVNKKEVERKGIEVDAKTIAFHNISFLSGYSFVHISPATQSGSDDMYSWNVAVQYDDRHSLKMELRGNYMWWNVDKSLNARYSSLIWDFNLSKNFSLSEKISSELFLTAHNMFNGSQYNFEDNKNPPRWLEAGVRLYF